MAKLALADKRGTAAVKRRLPVGAEVLPDGRVHFRVWAPRCQRVAVVIHSMDRPNNGNSPGDTCWLEAEAGGWFSGVARSARTGSHYGFQLDDDSRLYPDPASRFQPEGPHSLSQVVDPHEFEWTDQDWRGVSLPGQVIYELHVGTFTTEGTWAAAREQLQELASCGITLIEVMPVADFPGRFGWGYDGVSLFAPMRLYGTPDDFRRFVDQAHVVGIGVILDVVYNHVGPDGNYLPRFSDDFFTDRYRNDWGPAINFDGDNCEPVREFYLANAAYWIEEFHLDGLRLDATQDVHDSSDDHILAAVTRQVREAARGRSTVVIAESEPQQTRLIRPAKQGGYGIDAVWNDDLHHAAMVALSGHNEAYYTDYHGRPQEFISAIKYGYLYQGQWYSWQKQRRGSPTRGLHPAAFVTFIQNHDQIANSGYGLRCQFITSPGAYKAMTALILLAPGTPMLFQGQEFAASSPFLYFADHSDELAKKVDEGRKQTMSQFRSIAQPEVLARLPDPADPLTFTRSKLDFSERQKNAPMYQLHRDLLRLRREDPAFRAQRPGGVDGAVLSESAFVLRFFGTEDEPAADRLLVVNLGRDLHFSPAPEPLLAPPFEMRWETLWSTEDPSYGGCGTVPLDTEENWRIPGLAAVVLRPVHVDHSTK
jgi:maltooligosyltrehalose trehalohydrolase